MNGSPGAVTGSRRFYESGLLGYALSPRRRPAEPLLVDARRFRDLADELGVSYHRSEDRAKRGYAYLRRVGGRWNLVIWAASDDSDRYCQLRDYLRPGRVKHTVEQTCP